MAWNEKFCNDIKLKFQIHLSSNVRHILKNPKILNIKKYQPRTKMMCSNVIFQCKVHFVFTIFVEKILSIKKVFSGFMRKNFSNSPKNVTKVVTWDSFASKCFKLSFCSFISFSELPSYLLIQFYLRIFCSYELKYILSSSSNSTLLPYYSLLPLHFGVSIVFELISRQ